MSFKNKTVIITGASRGIGKAIGLRLAKEGANIVIASKSVEENEGSVVGPGGGDTKNGDLRRGDLLRTRTTNRLVRTGKIGGHGCGFFNAFG